MTQLHFRSHMLPALPTGDKVYTLKVTQEVAADAPNDHYRQAFSQELRFRLSQPDRPFTPDDIAAIYPADGSVGRFETTIPHVMLANPALPWLYRDEASAAGQPWLALVLAVGTEIAALQEEAEPGSDPDLPARRLVTVPVELLPDATQATLLAHVVIADEPKACLLCNRVPEPGQTHRALLVALPAVRPAAGPCKVRLLHSWRFTAESRPKVQNATEKPRPRPDFERIFSRPFLDIDALRLPVPADEPWQGWAQVLDRELRNGRAALTLRRRNGTDDVAFYRGPLLPAALRNPDAGRPPTTPTDASETETGISDLGLAAAFEIGRLLGLADRAFAQALLAWKRCCLLSVGRAGEPLPAEALPCRPAALDAPFPGAFFERLARIAELPFRYLVPDPRMLPPNSLRLFQIDATWVHRMLQGAFSVADAGCNCQHGMEGVAERLHDLAGLALPAPRFGLLLRSEAVTTWPHLEVDFSATLSGDWVAAGHVSRPAPGVLMALAKSDPAMIRFSIPVKTPHYEVAADSTPDPQRHWTVSGNSSAEVATRRVVFGHHAVIRPAATTEPSIVGI